MQAESIVAESPLCSLSPNNTADIKEMTEIPTADGRPTLQTTHEGEHHGDHDSGNIQITRATYTFVLCAAVNSINLGYDIGASTSAGQLLQEDLQLTRVEREVFVGSLNFWAST